MSLTTAQRKLVRKWVKMLESGKYKQGRTELVQGPVDSPKFCCLGVAKLAMGHKLQDAYEGASYAAFNKGGQFELEDNELEALGMDDNFQSKLIRLNDGCHFRFPTIAKRIRRELLGEKV